MDFGIAGKSALVLASSGGLGLGIAQALAAEGVNVLLTGRRAEELAKAADAINAAGAGKADWIAADLSDPATPQLLADAVAERLGGADILVNNTGGPPPGQMVDCDPDVIAAQFQTMVLSVMRVTRALLPHMRQQKWGRILTVASSGVEQPIPNLGISNALRSSLVGWSKSLANDLAAEGITVNMLLPGRIHTARTDQLDAAASKRTGKSVDEVRTASEATIPVGRYGTVEEFGAVAAFLCSARASYVTGSKIRCDGGAIRSV
jgi:3-oxoacyl-[acyl-carrier protein] reductase